MSDPADVTGTDAAARLFLKVEGSPGTIRLRTFLSVIGKALDVLTDLDSAISKDPHGTVEWYVTDLRVASLGAEVVPRPRFRHTTEFAPAVASNFVTGLRQLDTEHVMPPFFSEYSLKRISKASNELSKADLPGLQVTDELTNATAEVSEQASQYVKQLLAPVYKGIGSVTGTLEMISVHGGAKFNVYEHRTKRAVRCRFPVEQQSKIASILGERVIVRGIVHRNANGDPVSVERVEVELADTQQRVLVSDIAGIDPDFTGDETSVEYIARLRDG